MAKYSGEMKPEPERVVTAANDKRVSITFLEDRKFELYIGGEQFTFNGTETKEIPASYVDHPDFIQQKKNFSVSYVSSKGV
jgi:hypothetical protein